MPYVGYVIDGLPYVTPTLSWRDGERLFWHGSAASRMLQAQRVGLPVALAATHIDGLVVARSRFHHSLQYRSVIAFGTAAIIEDPAAKQAGLEAFIERLYPGRNREIRAIAPHELKATTLIGMAIEEAAAKIRGGGPIDDPEDYDRDCWAGVVPVELRIGAAIPDPRLRPDVPTGKNLGHFVDGASFSDLLLALARAPRPAPAGG